MMRLLRVISYIQMHVRRRHATTGAAKTSALLHPLLDGPGHCRLGSILNEENFHRRCPVLHELSHAALSRRCLSPLSEDSQSRLRNKRTHAQPIGSVGFVLSEPSFPRLIHTSVKSSHGIPQRTLQDACHPGTARLRASSCRAQR
jgi:hypothetical protein